MSDEKGKPLHDHPEYGARYDEFKMYQVLHDGNHDELIDPRYLWMHELEYAINDGIKLRRIREQRSRYTNFNEPVESTWVSIMLSDKMDIPRAVEKLFGKFSNDVDGEGHSLQTFIREKVGPSYIRFGRPYILTDAPEKGAATKAEEELLGIRPRFQLLDVLDVHDWQFMDQGGKLAKLKNIRTECLHDKRRETLSEKPGIELYSYQRDLVNGVYVTTVYVGEEGKDGKKSWRVEKVIALPGWSELPVAHLRTDPWLHDVSQQSLRIFNLESALDCGLDTQAFQRIFVASDMSDKQKLAFSEYAVNFLPNGSAVTVINPSSPTSLHARIDQSINYLYKVAFNRSHGLTQDSKEAPSAESTNAMNEERIAMAIAGVDDIENVVNEAIRHWAMFQGIKDFQERITIGRNITVENVESQIAIFQAYGDAIRKVPTWYKAHLKRVAEREGHSEIEDIKNEIDDLDPEQDQAQIEETRAKLLKKVNDGGKEGANSSDKGGAQAAGSAD